MFRSITGVVKNIALVDVDITDTTADLSTIAFQNYGTIQSCYVTGTIQSSTAVVAGIASQNLAGGVIENCYTSVTIEGDYGDGGIATTNSGGTIRNCYAVGDLSGESQVGGIAGNTQAQGRVENSVALNRQIKRRSGDNNYFGRVIGIVVDGGTASNNYARSDMLFIDGGSQAAFPDFANTHDGKDGANVSANSGTANGGYHDIAFWQDTLGWDFATVWVWNDDTNLPVLQAFPVGEQMHGVEY